MSFGQPGPGFGGPSGPGFGGGPPAGNAPLAHIPFTPEDDANLMGLARFARFAAVAAVLSALLTMLSEIVGVIVADRITGPAIGFPLCGGAVTVLLAGTLAMFLFRVAKAVELVVQTDDADQANLVEALRSLRGYFMVKGIVYIVIITLACFCFTLFMTLGASLMAAFAGG